MDTKTESLHNCQVCLVGELAGEEGQTLLGDVLQAVRAVTSETGEEYINDRTIKTFYVLKHFEGPLYDMLRAAKQCILGPPALRQALALENGLVHHHRRLYNNAMRGVLACVTGIRKKDELMQLVNLMHAMGGSIRKDMNSKVTHLISTHSGGYKYKYANTFRLAIVRPAWVLSAWDKRDEPGFSVKDEDFIKEHSLKAFEGQKICFFGFPTEEHQHMVEVLISNNGIPTQLDDLECSFVVVDEHATQEKPDPVNKYACIVKRDWFWYTIQNGYADETDYVFQEQADSIIHTPGTSDRRDSLPISYNKRKRKRLSQRLQLEGTPFSNSKRRSSISDAGLVSVSESFFDCTGSPDKGDSEKTLPKPDTSVFETSQVKKTMRFNHFMDFFNTESNYVGILETIVNLFKNPLEELAETSEALLNKSEIRAIFGNFIPIYDVHKSMLERLYELHDNWSEECLIGEIIIQHRDSLLKAYPPYINFFEQMKEMLQQCDAQNPRFHAFLKINQSKPECGRQSLQDLMIRPVQRLPSISLLLNDIMKYTMKTNPDHQRLEMALKAIKEVTMHINEDKRKTESRMAIFDIFNDIEGCPPHLVSSNRNFISKCEVTELSENLSARGDPLVFYLFSDTIEVCKKRSRTFHSTKSPSATKIYKHVKLLSLNAIRFVIDITDSPRAFGIIYHQDKDKLHSFTITDEEMDKQTYLKILCKQMAENACRTDTDKALLQRTAHEIDIDISDINLSTLSKAFKLAARTRMKVGRAFSFNKTPSKLKRAVSTMMTSPFGSVNSLTPSSQLAQMRLASCTNLQEATTKDDTRSTTSEPGPEALLAPLSVQPVRKNKSSSMSIVGRL